MTTSLETRAGFALLERGNELGLLSAQIQTVRSGSGAVVAIEGGAGMGKTRLMAAAGGAAEAAGLEVLAARGGEFEHEFAFGVVRQLFEPLLRTASSEERGELVAGAAGLALPLFDPAQLTEPEAADASFAMLHGLYWLAANIAQRRPLMVAVDDLHWVDQPSLRWLAYMARRLDGLPVLLVVASRPPDQGADSALVAEVLSDSSIHALRLRPLGRDAITAIAGQAFGVEPEPQFVSACERATGGNPLFLHALLDTLVRERTAPVAGNAARALDSGSDALSRFIATRLAHVGPEAVSVVRAAAVLGERAVLRDVAEVAAVSVEEAARAATALVKWELLRNEDPVEFSHPIVRNIVYESLGADDRTRLHRRAGEILLHAGAPPEQTAGHFVSALPGTEPFVRATLRVAAERSLAQGAPDAARRYLLRALDESPPDVERAELLHALGGAELHIDAYAAADHLRAALETADDPVRRAHTALLYFVAVEYLDRFDLGVAALEDALAGLGADDADLRRLLEAALLECMFWNPAATGRRDERISVVRDQELGDSVADNAVRGMLALHEAWLGASRERAVALARRALAHGISRGAFVAGLSACLTLTLAGELALARRLYDEAELDLRRRGDLVNLVPILLLRAHAALYAGDLRAAEEDLRAPEIESAPPGSTTAAYRIGFLVELLLERGELGEAERVIGSVSSEEQVHAGYRPFYLLGRGRFEAATGNPERAVDELRALAEYLESIGVANPAFVPWRSQLALVLRSVGRSELSRELASEELRLAQRWGAARPIGISLRALGLVEDGGKGEVLLRDAAAVLADSPARLEYARSLVDLGAALRRGNSRAEARGFLRDGLELAHRCGAHALESRANEELLATGARPRRIVSRGAAALTPSERRVARMAAQGMANKEIAQALFVTVKAVEMHLSNSYRKLGIRSRTQLSDALAETEVATP